MRGRLVTAYIIKNFLLLLLISVLVSSDLPTRTHMSPVIKSLSFKSPRVIGQSFRMYCDYELGNETLYAVKWYRNMTEFFRCQPDSSPSYKFFLKDGIDVDVSKSDNKSIYLRNISLESIGYYTCQITTDGPYFRTVEFTKQLRVIEVHIHLRITRFHVPPIVNIGDNARLHCEYDLGTEPLMIVRWFWNDFEFFRYEPGSPTPFTSHSYTGIDVDLSKSNSSSVYLRNLNFNSSGNYTCFVRAGEPHYTHITVVKELQVGLRAKVTGIYFSSPRVTGDSFSMYCDYELGSETLCAVKWYRNMAEFFRYLPDSSPSYNFFPKDGIDVDVSKSNSMYVRLRNLSLDSSGEYTCQILTDKPFYRKVQATKELQMLDNYIPSRIKILYIPSPLTTEDSVRLTCIYDLGTEILHSVIWYRNNLEFFRYEPGSVPDFAFYPRNGIDVDLSECDHYSVYLKNLSLESSGNYTCQVNTDKPLFRSIKITKELKIRA